MFDNIGGKIKALATVLCVIGMIVSLVFAIVLWSQNNEYNYVTRAYSNTISIGFGVLVGGCVASWVGSFFMYGFGELIDETTLNRQINQQILQRLDRAKTEENSSSTLVRDVPVAFANSTQRATRLGDVAPVRSGVTSDGWTCKKCGTRNRVSDISCKDCGAYK